MSLFCTLYDLAIRLLTAHPEEALGRLTDHHCPNAQTAEGLLRRAILQRTMPGEQASDDWGILRIFMRNLVNRAQAPLAPATLAAWLDDIEARHDEVPSRVSALVRAVADHPKLSMSLTAFLDRDRAPGDHESYSDWLVDRIAHYSRQSVARLDARELLDDLDTLARDPATKIPNMGLALASNLFADLGIRASAKPDLHVLPTLSSVVGRTLKPSACIEHVIAIAKAEAPILAQSSRFDWLQGGLYPRDVDRIIYLIGSDNFRLDGRRRKRAAPRRRELMMQALHAMPPCTPPHPASARHDALASRHSPLD